MAHNQSTPISLLILDDHPVFRLGLRQVLAADPRLQVVAEAADGLTALRQLRQLQPLVALLDMELPYPPDGLTVARTLRAEQLPTAVIFLTKNADEYHFNAALKAGAQGYLLKDSAYVEITAGIHAVAAGELYVSPTLRAALLEHAQRGAALATLTPTEQRILKLVAQHKTNRQIATELGLAAKTVEHYREYICRKLALKGPHALLHFALEHRAEL